MWYIIVHLLDDSSSLVVPEKWILDSFTNIGIGRGIVKSTRANLSRIDLYSNFARNDWKFRKYLFITKAEFDEIMDDMSEHRDQHQSDLLMPFVNKVLLGLLFVIQYPGDKILAHFFNISEFYVSRVLDEILPVLVGYFTGFVPNKQVNVSYSRLSRRIKYIIDNTLTKTRRTTVDQAIHYNGHYHMHGRLTQMLLDFNGYIIAYRTMIPGKVNDSLVAIYNREFQKIVGHDLALGDPGFQGVSYVVPGFGRQQVQSVSREVFYRVSKKEQRLIEHVNAFVKQCKSINKENTFVHNESRLLACIVIAFGLYNLKRSWGYFRGN